MIIRHLLLLSIAVLAACAPAGGQVLEESGTPTTGLFSDYSSLDGPLDIPHHLLDTTIRPTDLFGPEYVGIGADNEVVLVEWATGSQTRITHDGIPKSGAVFSTDYIAWVGYSHLVDQELPLADIFVFDRKSGVLRKVTQQSVPRVQLALDGHRLVWADKRNERAGHYTAYDIYAYDLSTDTEIAVAVAPGAQQSPSLSGDRVVWADNRDSPHRDDTLAGCENCAENRFDIYLYDFQAQTSRVLVTGDGLRASPSISGNRVAWIGFDANPAAQRSAPGLAPGDVYLLDLNTDQTRRLTQTPELEVDPIMAGDRLVWAVRQACDVVVIQLDGTPKPIYTGLFALDLNTSDVTMLTDYIEPVALLDADAALVVEGCMVGFKAYVVSLD